MDRRSFLRTGALGVGATYAGFRLLGGSLPRAFADSGPYGPLQPADALGLELPAGFRARVVATSGQVVPGTTYPWHGAPDGGACFATDDGGWIYVSNSELTPGGAGALRFAPDGSVAAAYRVLDGTSRNCAGGPTPWGTWLSCEETSSGRVWECDPLGVGAAVVRPAMGSFNHEAAACDPIGRCVYLTEDTPTGRLHRFRPSTWGDLSSGALEVAVVRDGAVTWTPAATDGTPFDGGEGAWYADGKVWFTTKGDNRVWELDVRAEPNRIRVVYDAATSPSPVLRGVDNIVGSPAGDLYVAEDGGNMELVLIEPDGTTSVFLRVLGQSGSELTGPAFSPDGSRLYVSSQEGGGGSGITYEVAGPFRAPPSPGATSTTSATSTIPATSTTSTTSTTTPASIVLAARVETQSRRRVVVLTWSGATSAKVEVRRNGSVVATTRNDGSHSDVLDRRGGTFRYRVSHPGGAPASNEVTLTV